MKEKEAPNEIPSILIGSVNYLEEGDTQRPIARGSDSNIYELTHNIEYGKGLSLEDIRKQLSEGGKLQGPILKDGIWVTSYRQFGWSGKYRHRIIRRMYGSPMVTGVWSPIKLSPIQKAKLLFS